MFLPIALERGRAVVERTLADGTRLPDERVSREHVELAFDGKAWTARDLGSTNGTFVEGVRATASVTVGSSPVVRIANTILLLREDIGPLRAAKVRVEEGIVVGPALARTLAAVERAARSAHTRERAAGWRERHRQRVRGAPISRGRPRFEAVSSLR